MMHPRMDHENRPNFNGNQKYPLILEIHGGPHMMYANTYVHEFQTLANEGYTILFTNPRGSVGYGQDFVNACRGDYGGMDYQDLMAAVDHVLATYDFIEHENLGVSGRQLWRVHDEIGSSVIPTVSRPLLLSAALVTGLAFMASATLAIILLNGK